LGFSSLLPLPLLLPSLFTSIKEKKKSEKTTVENGSPKDYRLRNVSNVGFLKGLYIYISLAFNSNSDFGFLSFSLFISPSGAKKNISL